MRRRGVNVRAYKRCERLAEEARSLFATAADDAKKQRASRPVKQNPLAGAKTAAGRGRRSVRRSAAAEADVQPPPQPPAPVRAVRSRRAAAESGSEEAEGPEPQPPPESEALVAARIAVQQYRRRLISMNLPVADAQRFERELKSGAIRKRFTVSSIRSPRKSVSSTRASRSKSLQRRSAAPDPTRGQLETAFARLPPATSRHPIASSRNSSPSKQNAQAYLLRGCARYTQAMLARDGNALLAGATSDMQAALRLDRHAAPRSHVVVAQAGRFFRAREEPLAGRQLVADVAW